MSAFLCSTEHFQKLADAMACAIHWNRDDGYQWNVTRFLEDVSKQDVSELSPDNVDRLIIKITNGLYYLNQMALMTRYGEKVSPEPVVSRIQPGRPLPAIEFYKALSCLSYQCAEERADETDLYKWLEAFEANIAKHIVNRLPEYDKLPWSI